MTFLNGLYLKVIYYDFVPTEGKISFSHMLTNTGGQIVLLGVVIYLIGIAISGKAGMLKEKDFATGHEDKDKDFNLVKGLIVAVISGILSSFFNYGIEAGKPMAEQAVISGANPLFQNNVTYVVLLWGGLTTNFIWCLYLNFKNKTIKNYTDNKECFVFCTCWNDVVFTVFLLRNGRKQIREWC